ncbi:MAG: SpoIIE family protein phosphatase [Phycisphaera sp.]|nr:SpoIIE family protein phosphatase [Phycisphaera sp.]
MDVPIAEKVTTDFKTPQIAVEITDPQNKVSRVPLLSNKAFVIGRSSSCDIQLRSQEVSRQHAELKRDPFGVWWLRDLDSTTGTNVNGVVAEDTAIKPGDRINIGPFHLRLVEMPKVPIDERSATHIRSLSNLGETLIETTHLATIKEFGERLMQNHDVYERLKSLCRLMVRKDFHGKAAVALRLRGRSGSDPDTVELCEPQLPPRGGHRPTLSKGLLRAVFHSGLPVLAQGDAEPTDPGALKLTIVDSDTSVAMAVPLAQREESMDVLYAVFPPDYGDPGWLALLTLAAQQFHQTEVAFRAQHKIEAEAAIAQELEEGQKIQKRFASHWGTVPGLNVAIEFHPSHWISGDFVDVLELADGRSLVLVGNVAGGGLTASVNLAVTVTMIRTLVAAGFELVDVFNRVDDQLGRIPPGDVKASLAALAIDTSSFEVETITAGVAPPFIVGAGVPPTTLAARPGQPLGGRDMPVKSTLMTLQPGQWICAMTEGVSSIRDSENRELGVSGWMTQVATQVSAGASSAEAAAGKLCDWTNRLLGERQHTDDRTFVLIRREA